MEANRAEEIMKANERVEVVHNGVYVWIDSVDTNKQTAKVHAEKNPADAKVVAVEELMEVQH